jgi:hypothetical protein
VLWKKLKSKTKDYNSSKKELGKENAKKLLIIESLKNQLKPTLGDPLGVQFLWKRFILLHTVFMGTAGGQSSPLGCGRKAEPKANKIQKVKHTWHTNISPKNGRTRKKASSRTLCASA